MTQKGQTCDPDVLETNTRYLENSWRC